TKPSSGLTYKYQWLRCNPSGGDDSSDKTCTAISGATRQSYTIVSGDVGKRMRSRVSAASKGGTTQATSAATSVVSTQSGIPASSAPPTVSGSAIVGSELTGAPGSWVGDSPITYSYQWLRCDKEGNACNPIAGKTSAKYTLVDADQGRTVRLRVVPRNSRGNADAFSSATDVVQANPSDGTITLPNGEKSVDPNAVPANERLVLAPLHVTSSTRERSTRRRQGPVQPQPPDVEEPDHHRQDQGEGHPGERRPECHRVHPLDTEGHVRRSSFAARDGRLGAVLPRPRERHHAQERLQRPVLRQGLSHGRSDSRRHLRAPARGTRVRGRVERGN